MCAGEVVNIRDVISKNVGPDWYWSRIFQISENTGLPLVLKFLKKFDVLKSL